jgi:hypothetical protein
MRLDVKHRIEHVPRETTQFVTCGDPLLTSLTPGRSDRVEEKSILSAAFLGALALLPVSDMPGMFPVEHCPVVSRGERLCSANSGEHAGGRAAFARVTNALGPRPCQ